MKIFFKGVSFVTFLFLVPVISFAQSANQPACALYATQTTVPVGSTAHISWRSANVDSGVISPLGAVPLTGEANIEMNVAKKITFTGTFTGFAGTAHCSVTITSLNTNPNQNGSSNSYDTNGYTTDTYSTNGYDSDVTSYTVTQTDPVQSYGVKQYSIDPANFKNNPTTGSYTQTQSGGALPSSGDTSQPAANTVDTRETNSSNNSSVTFQNPLSNKTVTCAVKGFITGVYLIGTPIMALAIAFAGFLLVQARGNPVALSKARGILFKVIIATALFMGSWLIGVALVNTANSIIPNLVSGIASC